MEKYYLNISKVPDIKTLWHSGWLFSDKMNTEIVLEVEGKEFYANSPLLLKVLYATLCEGILNSGTTDTKRKHDINYTEVDIYNYDTLAKELSKTTGFNFSIGIAKHLAADT